MEKYTSDKVSEWSNARGAFRLAGLVARIFDVEKVAVFWMGGETGGTLLVLFNGSPYLGCAPDSGDVDGRPILHFPRDKWVEPLVLCTLSGQLPAAECTDRIRSPSFTGWVRFHPWASTTCLPGCESRRGLFTICFRGYGCGKAGLVGSGSINAEATFAAAVVQMSAAQVHLRDCIKAVAGADTSVNFTQAGTFLGRNGASVVALFSVPAELFAVP